MVYFSAQQEKSHFVITIHDNGGGIEEDDIEYVFDSYFTTKDESVGTGIGLYICKDIIENNIKGEISVENERLEFQGKSYLGAKFTITIPS